MPKAQLVAVLVNDESNNVIKFLLIKNLKLIRNKNMHKFKQSLCSVSIALALSVSANSFAEEKSSQYVELVASDASVLEQDIQPTAGGNKHYALIYQGVYSGVSEGNDSSITIVGEGGFQTKNGFIKSAEIRVDGSDNFSSIEQINTQAYNGTIDCCNNYAWAYTTEKWNSAAANNTGNSNNITQIGGANWAKSEIQVGSYNTVDVYQEGFNPGVIFNYAARANQSKILVNGDYNTVEVTSVAATDNAANISTFEIEGDNNSAIINTYSDNAYLGVRNNNPDYISYFKGNGNSLVADFNDTGKSNTYVEFTGNDNDVSIWLEGNSTGATTQVKLENMKGNGNTFDVKSYGDSGNHNLGNFQGNGNTTTVNNIAGTSNKSIANFLVGDGNLIDMTFDGEGNQQINVGKNTGDDNVTNISLNGYKNKATRLKAVGNNNTITATVNGEENSARFSAANDPIWSPGFEPTSGDDNELIITQDGDRNYAVYMDAGDGRYYETTQLGDDNSSLVRGLGNEKYVTVYQEGDVNNAEITFNRTEYNESGSVGTLNTLEAQQLGYFNNIEVDASASMDMTVLQDGEMNEVVLKVTHSNPDYASNNTRHYYSQVGDVNMIESEINSAYWSKQYYNQTGNDNYIYWNEAGGAQNTSFIDQTGDMNTAYVTVASLNGWSEQNKVDIDQTGNYNEVDLDINGIRNGNTVWKNRTAGIYVEQNGEDNLLVGNDGFGFTIAGDDNMLFVRQTGSLNTIAGAMVGNDNTASIIQIGDNNFASISISAY